MRRYFAWRHDVVERAALYRLIVELAANASLAILAQQDGLTGLGNRRYFDDLLATELRRSVREAVPLGVVLIDIDNFKTYNDRYGHVAGDACLRRIAAAIRDSLQRPADRAMRYGGEEIVVLLPGTDAAGATEIGRRVCAAVADLKIEHSAVERGFVTISVGVSARTPCVTDCATDLIGAADRALYQAKSSGKNRVVCADVRQSVAA